MCRVALSSVHPPVKSTFHVDDNNFPYVLPDNYAGRYSICALGCAPHGAHIANSHRRRYLQQSANSFAILIQGERLWIHQYVTSWITQLMGDLLVGF